MGTTDGSVTLGAQSARLVLRPVAPEDAEPTSILMTADIASGLISWTSPTTPEQATERIARSRIALAERRGVDFAVCEAASGSLMGWLGFWTCDESAETMAIGYWLGVPFQGRRLMRDAVALAIPLARSLIGRQSIFARVRPGNRASIRILEENGFRAETADCEGLLAYRLEDDGRCRE